MGSTNNNGKKVTKSAGRNFVFSTVRPSDEDQNESQEMESEVVTPSTEVNTIDRRADIRILKVLDCKGRESGRHRNSFSS